jgi:hypothetical protein
LAENVILDENTIKAANEKGINILSTPESAYDIAKYLSKVL